MPSQARFGALAALSLIAALLTLAPSAFGQSEADREVARKLAAEGFEALQNKDYSLAEERFRRADALVHAPTLIVDQARALVGLGRLVEAHERYELVLREGVTPDAPWQWRNAYAEAEVELEALKPRLAWLTLRVLGPKRPKVFLDGKPVPRASLGVRRATDPGTHTVVVTASGYLTQEVSVSLKEGGSLEQTLRLEQDPEAIAKQRRRRQGQGTEYEVIREEREPDRTFSYITFGVAGAGLIVGAVSGGMFLSQGNALLEDCPNRVCTPETNTELTTLRNERDRFRLYRIVSGVSFGVALASAATGLTLWLLNPSPEDVESDEGIEVGLSSSSITVSGRF